MNIPWAQTNPDDWVEKRAEEWRQIMDKYKIPPSPLPVVSPGALIPTPNRHEVLREIRETINKLEALIVRLRLSEGSGLNTTQDELGNDLSV